MKILLLPTLLLAITALVGCTTANLEEHLKIIQEAIPNLVPPAPDTPAEPAVENAVDGTPCAQEDAIPFADLDFCYGGFDGSHASLVPTCTIADLVVAHNSLSYKWLSGGCESLGATSSSDYNNTLACLFCLIDGRWVGGKFDWISSSRLTRSFDNISSGYHGWDPTAVARATEYAFVIVSKDGRKRSNVIVCTP